MGKAVRALWVAYAAARPNPKPHHLIPWEELDEENKEVDRIIGEALYFWGYRDGSSDAGEWEETSPELPMTQMTYYALGDGRRIVVYEYPNGTGGVAVQRPWKRNLSRFTMDETTRFQHVRTHALAHRIAREMGGIPSGEEEVYT
jgi:hypothetical protein